MKKQLIITLCLVGFLSFAQNYAVNLIPDSLKQNANAVIRNYEKVITIDAIDKMTEKEYSAITVLSKASEHFTTTGFQISKNRSVKNVEIRILDADGKEIKKIKKRDFIERGLVDGSTLYSDYKILYYEYLPTQYPFTIVTESEIETSNTIFIESFQYFQGFKTAIEKLSFQIINNSGIELKSKNYNFKGFAVREDNELPKQIKFSLQNVKPIFEEDDMPSINQLFPITHFTLSKFQFEGEQGDFSSWENFGKWYYNHLLSSTIQIPQNVIDEAKNLIKDAKTTEEKMNILYKYMQNRTRYISIQLGIGGFKPINAEEVHKMAYGDCKGLSNYMRALLKAVDIESYFTLVNGSWNSKYYFDPEFPTIGGNHVILSVPNDGKTIWLECTNQDKAFNHLGDFTGNQNALQVTPNGINVVETQQYPSEINNENLSAKIVLNESTSTISIKSVYTGLQYENYMFFSDSDSNQKKERIKHIYHNISGLEIENFSEKNDRNTAIFTIDVQGNAPNLLKKTGNNYIFSAVAVGRMSTTMKKEDKRIYPISVEYGYKDMYVFTYQIPSNTIIETLPENIIVNDKNFGSYSLQFEAIGNLIKVTRIIHEKEGNFDKNLWNDFVTFKGKIAKADNSKILLKLK